MKTLSLKQRKNGFEYTQVLRGKRSCIFAQRFSEDEVAYEVFLIRVSPERYIHGKKIEATERFPHNEAFGKWAWSINTYERAIQKYNELEGII